MVLSKISVLSLLLPAVCLAFGPDKPTYVKQEICNVTAGNTSAAATSIAGLAAHAVVGASRWPGFNGRQPPPPPAPAVNVAYVAPNWCLPSDSTSVKFTAVSPTSVTINTYIDATCTTAKFSQPLSSGTCYGKYKWTVTSDVPVPADGALAEFYTTMDDCDKGDAVMLVEKPLGCSETSAGDWGKANCRLGIHGPTLVAYSCDDAQCMHCGSPDEMPIPVNKCVDAAKAFGPNDPMPMGVGAVRAQSGLC